MMAVEVENMAMRFRR